MCVDAVSELSMFSISFSERRFCLNALKFRSAYYLRLIVYSKDGLAFFYGARCLFPN